jgi:hypothetical protein
VQQQQAPAIVPSWAALSSFQQALRALCPSTLRPTRCHPLLPHDHVPGSYAPPCAGCSFCYRYVTP